MSLDCPALTEWVRCRCTHAGESHEFSLLVLQPSGDCWLAPRWARPTTQLQLRRTAQPTARPRAHPASPLAFMRGPPVLGSLGVM